MRDSIRARCWRRGQPRSDPNETGGMLTQRLAAGGGELLANELIAILDEDRLATSQS